jgi:hypothetical protein
MKFGTAFTFLLIGVLAFAEDKPIQKPPPEFEAIISFIQAKRGGFDPSFLPTVPNPIDVRKNMTKDFSFYTIRAPKIASDAFSYEICLNTISKEFWIFRTGGLSNTSILYGPGKVKI